MTPVAAIEPIDTTDPHTAVVLDDGDASALAALQNAPGVTLIDRHEALRSELGPS